MRSTFGRFACKEFSLYLKCLLCMKAFITLQRYDENPDGAILKIECFTVGICSVSNETQLARSRYLLDELHFRGITWLRIGLLVRIADGDDIVQLVVGRDIETVEEELALLVRQ